MITWRRGSTDSPRLTDRSASAMASRHAAIGRRRGTSAWLTISTCMEPRSGPGRHHTRIRPVDSDVADLIARRNYAKALELLQAQAARRPQDARLRLKLADVLILAGRGKDAAGILMDLADAEAADGFAAKAIAILKRIEKIQPGRRDVEERLAHLIQEKVRLTPGAAAATAAAGPPELGLEEFDP